MSQRICFTPEMLVCFVRQPQKAKQRFLLCEVLSFLTSGAACGFRISSGYFSNDLAPPAHHHSLPPTPPPADHNGAQPQPTDLPSAQEWPSPSTQTGATSRGTVLGGTGGFWGGQRGLVTSQKNRVPQIWLRSSFKQQQTETTSLLTGSTQTSPLPSMQQ